MAECSKRPANDRLPLIFIPGISDVIPENLVQHFTYLKTGETGYFDYRLLRNTLRGQGIDLHIAQPDWKTTTPDTWADDMTAAAAWLAGPHEAVIVGGFSFGALLAAEVAERLRQGEYGPPRKVGVMAVSLTCLFGEWVKEAWDLFPEDKASLLKPGADGRPKVFPPALDMLADVELPDVICPAQIYSGALEAPIMHDVSKAAHATWPRSELITIPEAGHDITKPRDLQAIAANIGRLAAVVRGATY